MSDFFTPQMTEAELPFANAVVIYALPPLPPERAAPLFSFPTPPMFREHSTVFVPADQTLLAYDMPVTSILEDNSVKDIVDSLSFCMSQLEVK